MVHSKGQSPGQNPGDCGAWCRRGLGPVEEEGGNQVHKINLDPLDLYCVQRTWLPHFS